MSEQQPGNGTAENIPNQPSDAQELIDLASVGKFKFDGSEMTVDELKNSMMRQSDYTRKTQALAENRKFFDNLSTDLLSVMKSPDLADEFKKIYPPQFHQYLDILNVAGAKKSSGSKDQGQAPKEDSELANRLERLEQMLFEKEVQASDAQLDSKLSRLNEKYEFADEALVLAKAEALAKQGVRLTDHVWERLYKDTNDAMQEKVSKSYKAKLQKQRSLNSQGKDIGPGGSIAGSKPKAISFKEATEMMIKDLEAQRS